MRGVERVGSNEGLTTSSRGEMNGEEEEVENVPKKGDVENPTAVELELRLEIAWVLVLELELETIQTGDTGGD